MTQFGRFWGAAAVAAAIAQGAVAWADDAPAPPSAREVMVRGRRTLRDAIRAAVPPTATAAKALLVFVLDPTPYVRAAGTEVAEAIASVVAGEGGTPWAWRLAALGKPLGPVAQGPERVDEAVRSALAEEGRTIDTLGDLRKTLGPMHEPGACMVCLADWHFEDDSLLEHFATSLTARRQSFSVVGTEAAFLRGWVDGVRDPGERAGDDRLHLETVGRSPFGPPLVDAPWHGGEGAYPPQPYRFAEFLWETEFWDAIPLAPEDLRERVGGKPDPDEERFHAYPLPSAFGSYGLMRLAGLTGGRYVAWSWNPARRAKVTYEYSRCDLFPPDLRSRAEILAGIPQDPCAIAMIRAWNVLQTDAPGVRRHTPPLDESGRIPRPIDLDRWTHGLWYCWDTPEVHIAFLRAADRHIAGIGRAAGLLEAAVEQAGDPADDRGRRTLAEARLFLVTLRIIDFELREGRRAARKATLDLWGKEPGKTPGLGFRVLVPGHDVPEGVTVVVQGQASDPEAFGRVVAWRKEHLERYRGTPFAAVVEMNDVFTLPLDWWEPGGLPPRATSPSDSGRPAPGGSGGGGPTTGK